MKTSDAIAYFGSAARLAEKLGIRVQAVSQWGELVPKGRAYEIQALTNGGLKVAPELYGQRKAAPAEKRERLTSCAGERRLGGERRSGRERRKAKSSGCGGAV